MCRSPFLSKAASCKRESNLGVFLFLRALFLRDTTGGCFCKIVGLKLCKYDAVKNDF